MFNKSTPLQFQAPRKCVLIGLMAVLLAAVVFCFCGCSHEGQVNLLNAKPPLSESQIEQAFEKNKIKAKRREINMDAQTAAKHVSNAYWYTDSDGLEWLFSSYKKAGSTYLSISINPSQYTSGEEPGKLIDKNLPEVFLVASDLYGDGIEPKAFEEFWNFHKSSKEARWGKEVGENIIYVNFSKDPTMKFKTATSVNICIEKKSWADASSINFTQLMLWGNTDALIDQNISTVNSITDGKVVPIKSCYVINGDVVDVQKMVDKTRLPDEKEMFSKLKRTFPASKTDDYYEAGIKDSSGKIKVIIPTPLVINESGLKAYKYFVAYEYKTDQGKSLYVVGMMRSLKGELLKELSK